MKRRDFVIRSSSAVMASTIMYPTILKAKPSINIALVGAGRRGTWVLAKMIETGRVNPVVLCDVWGEQIDRSKEFLKISSIKQSYNLDEVLKDSKIDAVILATPDHLHKDYAVRILEAKKHLYLEKPVTLKFGEGEIIQKAVSKSGMICQTGTQQRSSTMYRRVKQEFFSGTKLLGEVVFVRAVWSDFGWQRRVIKPRPIPKDFRWEKFLGNAPNIPYEWARYTAWRNYKEYGAGILSDLLTHWADVAQWMMDDETPTNAVTTGGIYHLNDGRSNPDTVNSIISYPKNWNLSFECSVLPVKNSHDSVLFLGTKGNLELFRAGYIYTPHGQPPRVFNNEEDLDLVHINNFLDAIEKGAKPLAPIEVGLQAVTPSHLATAAYWSGERMKLNEDKSKIVEA
ncbi:Gfo/Idh/MocA family oxidoreductase [Croceitalea sp. MTPC9]|uniref:Gfo/Idh/MocA family protein n=1 Tax=unclassified Croceitalea TaxID=2632280 RepID=UPI002B394F76|nr:Gfo/Idh/MocA family oxidoreductase [Croceitalea sp. MTPC6]GMN15718.1 Gfo/Idh/MocA family oxidoreductase [Croceitalea sp. MTPC9]